MQDVHVAIRYQLYALDIEIFLRNDSSDMVAIYGITLAVWEVDGGLDVIDMDVILVDQKEILFQISRYCSMDSVAF